MPGNRRPILVCAITQRGSNFLLNCCVNGTALVWSFCGTVMNPVNEVAWSPSIMYGCRAIEIYVIDVPKVGNQTLPKTE